MASLALLVLASAAHFKHHLDDPDCGSTPSPTHVCFCAGLHAGVIGESIVTGPARIPTDATIVVLEPCVREAAAASLAGSPRAPPLA